MPQLIYLLCAVTSAGCAAMLVRGYRRSHASLLLWSAACFVGLALNNVLLFIDLALVPAVDLSLVRNSINLGSVALLLYGLVWKAH